MNPSEINEQQAAQRWARWFSTAFAVAPILWCVILYSFVLHWHGHYGHWPDTGTKRTVIAIQLSSHESLTAFVGMALFYSLPLWAAFVAFLQRYVFGRPGFLHRLGLLFVPWALVFALAVLDPGHFINWFFD